MEEEDHQDGGGARLRDVEGDIVDLRAPVPHLAARVNGLRLGLTCGDHYLLLRRRTLEQQASLEQFQHLSSQILVSRLAPLVSWPEMTLN